MDTLIYQVLYNVESVVQNLCDPYKGNALYNKFSVNHIMHYNFNGIFLSRMHTHIHMRAHTYTYSDDFFSGMTSSSYNSPPSYSHMSGGGGGAYSSGSTSSSSSSFSSNSAFFGKHSAFGSSDTSSTADKPSSKVSSFGSSYGKTEGGASGSTWKSGSGYAGGSGRSTGSGGSDNAQQRFSNAKSISSDQYFGRNESDNQVSFVGCSDCKGCH